MITEHESFPPPANRRVSIWRYMDLSKFVWMIQKGALFFSRSDLMGDPYEGYYPRKAPDGEDEYVRLVLQGFKNPSPQAEAAIRSGFKGTLAFAKSSRRDLFISCWHMNETESLAMWKLYTNHNESICIRSNFENLAKLLDPECFLGCVRYINYEKNNIDSGNLLNYIMHKRHSFEHEREARAVIWQNRDSIKKFDVIGNNGLLVPIDVSTLIEEIFVSPDSNPMLRDIVQQLALTYGVNAPVRQSEVNAAPNY